MSNPASVSTDVAEVSPKLAFFASFSAPTPTQSILTQTTIPLDTRREESQTATLSAPQPAPEWKQFSVQEQSRLLSDLTPRIQSLVVEKNFVVERRRLLEAEHAVAASRYCRAKEQFSPVMLIVQCWNSKVREQTQEYFISRKQVTQIVGELAAHRASEQVRMQEIHRIIGTYQRSHDAYSAGFVAEKDAAEALENVVLGSMRAISRFSSSLKTFVGGDSLRNVLKDLREVVHALSGIFTSTLTMKEEVRDRLRITPSPSLGTAVSTLVELVDSGFKSEAHISHKVEELVRSAHSEVESLASDVRAKIDRASSALRLRARAIEDFCS